jgi:hypothetical protein
VVVLCICRRGHEERGHGTVANISRRLGPVFAFHINLWQCVSPTSRRPRSGHTGQYSLTSSSYGFAAPENMSSGS